ncbi:MAG TPA: hypothetical protein VI913_00770 [Candidatus Peribacteraceae bacterium]|nr:hypothetical protein [Candidatus Peribacteraceae bacterium]
MVEELIDHDLSVSPPQAADSHKKSVLAFSSTTGRPTLALASYLRGRRFVNDSAREMCHQETREAVQAILQQLGFGTVEDHTLECLSISYAGLVARGNAAVIDPLAEALRERQWKVNVCEI